MESREKFFFPLNGGNAAVALQCWIREIENKKNNKEKKLFFNDLIFQNEKEKTREKSIPPPSL